MVERSVREGGPQRQEAGACWFLKTTALRLGKYSPLRAVPSQRQQNCYCQKPVLVIQHSGPLLHVGVQVTSWKRRQRQICPTLSCELLWKIPWCVTGGFSVLPHFVNHLTVSKLYFQNTCLQTWIFLQDSHRLTELNGRVGTILWMSLRTSLSA